MGFANFPERAGLALSLVVWLAFGTVPVAQAQGSCDPTISSCVPGAGGGAGSCNPVQQALGQCTPGGGGGGGGGQCTAPPGGNPSCGGGPASTSNAAPSSGAGNPINLLNGNKYQEVNRRGF